MPVFHMVCVCASMSESEGCSVQYNSAIPSLPGHFHSNHQHRLGLAAHCKKGSINGSCDCWRRPHCLHMLPRSPVLMTSDQWPLWPIFNHNFTQSCGLFTSKTPGNFSSWKVGPTPSLMMFCYDNDAREFHNLNMNGKHAQFRLINKHRQDYQCSNDFSLSRIKEHPKMDHPSRLTFKGLSVTSLCLVTPCDGERAAW